MRDEPDFRAMSKAVQAWYRFYETVPDTRSSEVLCRAAIDLFNSGVRTVEDIQTALIGTYVGILATKVNAPTSSAVH